MGGSGSISPLPSGGLPTGVEGPGLLPTLLPPARYAQIMQIPLPHFQQLGGAKAPIGTCDDLWDQTAREALVDTMLQAEGQIMDYLSYPPAPMFITDEKIPLGWAGSRSDWGNAELVTNFGYVECFGTEQFTLVEAGATVSYVDNDNDPLGREELAVIGGGVYAGLPACADPCDAAVFFTEADGAAGPHHPKFEIRPLRAKISGSTMTITGESSLFVRPELWNLTAADCKGSADQDWRYDFDLSNLVGQVDVYCRSINRATPVTLRWDGVCSCGGAACSHATQTGCAYVTNNRLGFFSPRPATWNGSTNLLASPNYSSPPESVRVNYRAGLPLGRDCRMDPNLERAIVKLTNALMPSPPCGYCELASKLWDDDRTIIKPLTLEAANMPWGTNFKGALEAWRIVKLRLLERGSKMGR